MHPPSDVQQVPVDGHGFGAHAAPEMKSIGNEHAPEVPTAQVPSVAQHAPVWARAAPVHSVIAIIASSAASSVEWRQSVLVMGILDG